MTKLPLPNNTIFVDFETYYAPKDRYDLKAMSIMEYVRDPRFAVHGVGYAIGSGPVVWDKDLPDINWQEFNVVAHNIKFDGFILAQHYGINPALWIDTKAMAKAVIGKRLAQHSLSEVSKFYGLEPKGVMKTAGLKELDEAQWNELGEYCKHDVELCRQVFFRLDPLFPFGQYDFMDRTVRMFVNPVLVLNRPLLEKLNADEIKRRTTIFEEIGIDKKVFSSNPKFAALLVEEGFDVPVKPSPRTGKEIPALALGDEAFLDMAESQNHHLRLLCEARIAAKSTLLETRSARLLSIAKTGTWAFDVEFSGAKQTHRLSGGRGAGGNPQNFTKDSPLRQAVEAPPGHCLVVGDFANVELRIQAYLSGEKLLIDAIERDIDIYCQFGTVFFGRPITRENAAERFFAKCAVLGLGYGMGAKRFIKAVRVQTDQIIDMETAQKAVDLYRGRYAGIPSMWNVLETALPLMRQTKEGEVIPFHWFPFQIGHECFVLPSGLRVQYPELRKDGRQWVYGKDSGIYGGKLFENLCQALAGELCKEAASEFGDAVTGLVHDEIHLVVPEKEAEAAKARLEAVMSLSPAWLPNMKMKGEVGYGRNWLEA